MRWTTHQVGALSCAVILHLSPEGLVASWLGGILPDVFDQKIAGCFRNRQRAFNNIHRGFTHWPGLWLTLLVLPLIPNMTGGFSELIRQACFGLALGGLSHCLLDMLTPQGIPFNPFSRKNRFSLKLCKTGSVGEYLFLAAMVVGMCVFMRGNVVSEFDQIRRLIAG